MDLRFGVLTLTALVVVIASGCVLSLGGATWWHVSSVGHYVILVRRHGVVPPLDAEPER